MSEPIDLDMLLRAYAIGVFPMADSRDAASVYWVEPKRRAILPLDGFHLSKSLAKTLKSARFTSTANRAFAEVVAKCGEPTPERRDTWINPEIAKAVDQLHALGHAHSIETWDETGALAGGLYGISLGRAFFGESMFSRQRDASKVAMAHLVARLRAGGFDLLDCQFMTPHLASLGAIEISREDYVSLLDSALSPPDSPPEAGAAAGWGDFLAFDRPEDSPPRTTTVSGPVSGWRIWQALVQTS